MSTGSDTGRGTTRGEYRRRWRSRHAPSGDPWWRYNRTIRFYGLLGLGATKLADVATTAVGIQYIPSIVEANPVAEGLFAELGIVTGLTVLGFASVLFAACAAELFGLEVRRRFDLPKTALFAQASIYLTLSILFGVVAAHNGLLIADQATGMLTETLVPPVGP